MPFSKFINPTFVLLKSPVLISSCNETNTLLLLSSSDKLSVYCLIINLTKLFSTSINLDYKVT